MNMNRNLLVVFALAFCLGLLFLPLPMALGNNSPEGNTLDSNSLSPKAMLVKQQIEQAKGKLVFLMQLKLNTARVYDLYQIAVSFYESNVLKEKAGEKADYRLAEKNAREAVVVADLALRTFDKLNALKSIVDSMPDSDGKKSVLAIIAEADIEMNDARYEDVDKLIEDAYAQMTKAETISTKAAAVYDAASKTLESILAPNLMLLLGAIFAILALRHVLQGDLKKRSLLAKIKNLERRKIIVSELIKKTQTEFYEKNEIPEVVFKIREETFKKKEQDLDRLIILAKEDFSLTQTTLEKIFRRRTGNQGELREADANNKNKNKLIRNKSDKRN